MSRPSQEVVVGGFVLAGLACVAVLAAALGRTEPLFARGYEVYASFGNAGGLARGASVEIAGVQVGRVTGIGLDRNRARVALRIRPHVRLTDDAIVSIRTRGLIGEKYVTVSQGASERLVQPGERMRETEDPIDLEQLISSYVMGKI
jgi:phospholipid/cholesterol/gamma-HCH transport system substrate-binding protein